jgi:hypothetical protein
MKDHYAHNCKKFFKDDQKKIINRRNLRRLNSSQLKKDY